MDGLKLEYSNLVRFVKPHTEKDSKKCETASSSSRPTDKLDGKDVSRFYTELVSTNTQETKTTNKKCFTTNKKRFTNKTTSSAVTERDLLKAAQHGDIEMVKKCLDRGIDIDSCDGFGWTSLMCAACSGNADVVQVLLESAADTSITDSAGRDVKSIALQSGHQQIADQITNFERIGNLKQSSLQGTGTSSCRNSSAENQQNKHEGFFCVVCKSQVNESSKSKHEASTVHLFNLKLKPKVDTFLEHSTNKGYHLMLKSGWDGQKGLGPKGEGQKYPVKTILKRDRKCLGADVNQKSKAKVTHYGPRDVSAVQSVKKKLERKMTARTLSKRAQKAQERKKRNWERNLRSEFNSDFTLK